MKGRTPRIFNFFLALALLASTVAVMAGPARTAEAATNNTFDAVSPADSRSFATASNGNVPLFIAVSPTYAADKTLYVVANKSATIDQRLDNTRLLRSTDGGVSWTAGQDPLTSLTTGADIVRGLAVAPNGTLVLLVTLAADAKGQLFRSTDGGSTWTKHSASGAGALVSTPAAVPTLAATGGDPPAFALAPNFASNGQVLVGQANGKVARYDQNRANWEELDFSDSAVCGGNGVILAAAFHPGYASNEESWVLCSGATIAGTRVARQERLSAAAAVGNTSVGSANRLDTSNQWISGRLKFDRSNVIYVGGQRTGKVIGGIFELVGTTWTARATTIFGGSATDTVLGSKGAIADFEVVSGTGTTARIVATIYDEDAAATAGDALAAVTRDGGSTWAKPAKLPGDIRGANTAFFRQVVAGPDGTVWVGNKGVGAGNRGGLFAGKFIGADFGFSPMGITTATFTVPTEVGVIASPNYGSDSTVGLVNADGLWLSTNLGPSTKAEDVGWRLAFPAASLVSAAFSTAYATDKSIYVVNSNTAGDKGFRSFDGGVIWEAMKTTRDDGFPADAAAFRKIISGGTGVLYAVTDDTGSPAAVTTNHGDNWSAKGPAAGLNTSDGRDIAAAGSVVAVGARTGGQVQVFVSKDSAATWARVGTRNIGGAGADIKMFVSPNYATDGVVIAGTNDDTQGRVETSYGDLYRSTKDADWVRIDTQSEISSGLADESLNIVAIAGTATPLPRVYAITSKTVKATTGAVRSLSYVTGGGGGAFRGPCASASPGTAVSSFATAAACGAGALTVITGTRLAVGGGATPTLFVTLGDSKFLARITDLGLTAPTLTEPADLRGFTDTPVGGAYQGINLKWSSVSGTDANSAYEVNVSESSKFPSFGAIIRGRVMIPGNTTSWVYTSGGPDVSMPTLERGKDYYWRVRVGDGTFSAARKFTYEMLRPLLSRPDNGSEVNTLRPFFAWKSTGIGAAGTEVDLEADVMAFEVSTDVNFAKDKTQRTEYTGIALSYEPPENLVAGTTYFWRVQGGKIRDGKPVWGAFGGPYSFRTPAAVVPPPPPVPVGPAKVVDVFKAIVADVTIVWFFDEKTQSWKKYDPKAPPFVSDFVDVADGDVVLIIAAKDIKGFRLGVRTYDLVKGNNYKAYLR